MTILLAGTVKGAIGIGLPAMAVGILTLFIEPKQAVAIILFPMLVSNIWQCYRGRMFWLTLRRYWMFAVVLFVGVGATNLTLGGIADKYLLGVTGVVILVFVAVSFGFRMPRLPDRLDRPAQFGFGVISGLMGGLTGVWGPPMVIYLSARQTEKDEFVATTGLLILVGSLPLLGGYLAQGFMDRQLAVVSATMVVPTLIGFTLGEYLRSRMSTEKFRRVLLFVFLGLGLNLIRRALLG